MTRLLWTLLLTGLCGLQARAEEPTLNVEAPATPTPAVEKPAPPEKTQPAQRVVVVLPEQIDGEWFWFYGDQQAHVVQTEIERALLRAGFDVADAGVLKALESTDPAQLNQGEAVKAAQAAEVTLLITGTAKAVKAMQGEAYGVNVVRAQADITARIVRVRDGKILAVATASALEGGQAVRAAGQNALKKAGKDAGRELVAELRKALDQP